MATYKGIQGYSVRKLTTDPTASEAGGQLWYSASTGKFKVSVAGAGAWASGLLPVEYKPQLLWQLEPLLLIQ